MRLLMAAACLAFLFGSAAQAQMTYPQLRAGLINTCLGGSPGQVRFCTCQVDTWIGLLTPDEIASLMRGVPTQSTGEKEQVAAQKCAAYRGS
jgi:hypothetical protein